MLGKTWHHLLLDNWVMMEAQTFNFESPFNQSEEEIIDGPCKNHQSTHPPTDL